MAASRYEISLLMLKNISLIQCTHSRNIFQQEKRNLVSMLWFNFIFGLKFFKPVCFVFPFVLDYDNEYQTMKYKNQPGLKNFKPNIKLNHNISKRPCTCNRV